ncbi:site-specific integrase, partial [bacterium]|nr:site-specific integrase [bacterium]
MVRMNKTDPHQHLKDIGERFINLIATTLTKTTVINYRTKILKFICFLNNHYPQVTSFSQLSRSPHMEHWLTHLAESYSKEDTRRAYIISIKRFLNDIYEWEWEKPPKNKLLDSRD